MQYQKLTKPIPFIRELCKHKTEEEILEAEDNFRNYLLLVAKICEQMEQDGTVDSAIDKTPDSVDSIEH